MGAISAQIPTKGAKTMKDKMKTALRMGIHQAALCASKSIAMQTINKALSALAEMNCVMSSGKKPILNKSVRSSDLFLLEHFYVTCW